MSRRAGEEALAKVSGSGVGTETPLPSARFPGHRLGDTGSAQLPQQIPQGLEPHKRPLFWSRAGSLRAGSNCGHSRCVLCVSTDDSSAVSSSPCKDTSTPGPRAAFVSSLKAPSPNAVMSPACAPVRLCHSAPLHLPIPPSPEGRAFCFWCIFAKCQGLAAEPACLDGRAGHSFSLVRGEDIWQDPRCSSHLSSRGRQALSRGDTHGTMFVVLRGSLVWDTAVQGREASLLLPSCSSSCVFGWRSATCTNTWEHGLWFSPRGLDFVPCPTPAASPSGSRVLRSLASFPPTARVSPVRVHRTGFDPFPADDIDGVLGFHDSRRRRACFFVPTHMGNMMAASTCLLFDCVFPHSEREKKTLE